MRVLYLSSAPEDLRFINKFSEVINHITCVHTCLYSYFNKNTLRFESSSHHLCFKNENINQKDDFDPLLADFNVKAKLLNSSEILPIYFGFYNKLEKLISNEDFDLIMIPSGRMLSQKILKYLGERYDLPMIFIGYGNYPGKTFLDRKGTDFQSSLRNFPMSEYISEHPNVWASRYLQAKLKSPKPPQSKGIIATKVKRIFRFGLCKFEQILSIAHDTNYKFIDVFRFVFGSSPPKVFHHVPLVPSDYIFYPCQLSSDAQLLLNADLGNLEAIKFAAQEAMSIGKRLIVKLHPAETDASHLRAIFQLKQECNFEISNQNTYDILKSCAFVITINSTMGMEAKAIGKQVKVLGRAIYSDWNARQAINYFENILFDIDYFSSEKVNSQLWLRISQRLEL